jgi:hypothetical protein
MFTDRFKDQERDFFRMKAKDISKSRKERDDFIRDSKYRMIAQEDLFRNKIENEGLSAKKKYANLREQFDSTVDQLQKTSQSNVETMQMENQKDKAEFLENMTKRKTDEMYEMRKGFRGKIQKLSADSTMKINHLEKENKNVKLEMDEKVDDIMGQTKEELNYNQEILGAKLDHAQQASKEEKKLIEDRFELRIFKMKEEHNQKIEEMAYENQKKLKDTTRDFNKFITKTNSTNLKEKEKMRQDHDREVQLLKSAFETDKARTVSQFRNQITDMKRAYREQLDRMRNFDEQQKDKDLA